MLTTPDFSRPLLIIVQYRLIQKMNSPSRLSIHVENHNLIPPLSEHGRGHVECPLRSDIPKATQKPPVDPNHAFAQLPCINKGVHGLIQIKVRLIKAWSGTVVSQIVIRAYIIHGQWIDLPSCQRRIPKRNPVRNTGALVDKLAAVIHSSGVLHQDVQACVVVRRFYRQRGLVQSPVQRPGQLSVKVYLRVTM